MDNKQMRCYSSEWPDERFSWLLFYTNRTDVQSNVLLVDIGTKVWTTKSLPQCVSST